PTLLLTMVLLVTIGNVPVGSVMLIARQGLLAKILLAISGEDPLTKATTPDRNCVSQVFLMNTLPAMVGDETLPPMAAPNPPEPSALLTKRLEVMVGEASSIVMPAPKLALPC